MTKHSVDENAGFGFLVRDVSRLIRKRFERKATKVGLTQAQWSVISHLVYHEGINQAALAEMLDIEPITLVGLLDRLEQAGWVERRHDPNDRRVRLLYLTKRVNTIVKKMESIKAQVRKEAFAGVLPKEERQIMQTLLRIKHNLVAKGELFSHKNG